MRKKKLISAGMIAVVLLSGCSAGKENYLKQAETQLEKNNYEQSLELFSKAIMEDENLQIAYRGSGIAYLHQGEYEKAIDYFIRALKESDGVVGKTEMDLSYYLARAQMAMGKYEDAIQTYNNILNFDKKQTDARIARGVAYTKINDNDKAKLDFETALKKSKDNLTYYYQAYEALNDSGCSDDAIKYLNSAVKCKTESNDEKFIMAKVQYGLGEQDKAMKLLNECKNAGYAPAVFYMGTIYEQQDDCADARECYESYMNLVNVTVAEYQTIAGCMVKQGDYAAALEVYQNAMDHVGAGDKKAIWFGKVVLYEQSGDFASAKTEIESFLKEYPDDESALHEYEFLKTR